MKEGSLMLGGDPGVATTRCLVIFQPADFFEGEKKNQVKVKVLDFVPVNLAEQG